MSTSPVPAAFAPLMPLLADPTITEIMVDAPDQIYIERRGQLEDTAVRFADADALRAAIDTVVTFAPGQLAAEARLSDGSRVCAVLPPAAVDGPCFIIRKFIDRPLSWERLFEYRSVNTAGRALLEKALLARQNILVAGGTGSGKTTILNLLAESLPAAERIVLVEQAHEFPVRHPRTVRLEAAASGQTFAELIRTATRLRPDRLVIGELNGPEAYEALAAMDNGYDGTLTTLHANSPEDALARLEAHCLMANLGLGLGEIRSRIAALQLIVQQMRLPIGRRIVQITAVRGIENERYVLATLMRYDPARDELVPAGPLPDWAA